MKIKRVNKSNSSSFKTLLHVFLKKKKTKKRQTYAQGEACSSTERAELREEMRGMRELALHRAER